MAKAAKTVAMGKMSGKAGKDSSYRMNSGTTKKSYAGRAMNKDGEFGPRLASNVGAKVSDGAGTREEASLPPETVAMAAPMAEMSAESADLAADVLPVPSVDQPLIKVVEPWDLVRDRTLGNTRKGGMGRGSM